MWSEGGGGGKGKNCVQELLETERLTVMFQEESDQRIGGGKEKRVIFQGKGTSRQIGG